jgi:SAM-dependent methyltransferase
MPAPDATQRFSNRVDNYVRYRPGYPAEVLTLLREQCGLSPQSSIADIGFGTGIFTRILLKNGNTVFGIEPNPEMREAGEKLLAEFSNFRGIQATAEETTLADHSVDFVTAAQAAHWFKREAAHREFSRILKRDGWVVLLWNERITEGTAFLAEYEQILLRYGTDYAEVRHERTTEVISEFFAPAPLKTATFTLRQTFDLPAFEGRVFSSSYTPSPGDPRYAPLLQALRDLFANHQVDGKVAFDYHTRVFYGRFA